MSDQDVSSTLDTIKQRQVQSRSDASSDSSSNRDDVSVHNSGSDIKPEQTNTIEVPRTIGLLGGVSFIVGTIIGSGIFISPKGVAEGSGSVGLSLINWTICGIVSMLGALCYAELGTVVKASGADYAYLHAAFGPVLSYMFAWTFSWLIKPADVATKMLTCAQYILVPLFEDGCGDGPPYIKKILAVVVLLSLLAINVYSVRLASRLQIVFTLTKLAALAIIIIGGIVKLAQGNTQHLKTGFDNSETDIGTIALGLYSGMFAYDGWGSANFITEEIKRPERNLPLAIIIGVPTVIVVYLLTNISYFTVMSMDELIASPAVAITWADRVIPTVAWLIPIFVAISTYGSTNGSLFASGRLIFVAARNEHFPDVFAMVHIKKFTPVLANIVVTLIAIIFLTVTDVSSLIKFTSFLKWIFYGLNMISLIILRYHKDYKDIPRPVKVPLVIPVFVFLAALFIVIVPIVVEPQIEFIFAAVFIAIGFIFYIPFIHFKIHLGCIDYVTKAFQMVFQISKPAQTTF